MGIFFSRFTHFCGYWQCKCCSMGGIILSWCFNFPIIKKNQSALCVNPPRSPLHYLHLCVGKVHGLNRLRSSPSLLFRAAWVLQKVMSRFRWTLMVDSLRFSVQGICSFMSLKLMRNIQTNLCLFYCIQHQFKCAQQIHLY